VTEARSDEKGGEKGRKEKKKENVDVSGLYLCPFFFLLLFQTPLGTRDSRMA